MRHALLNLAIAAGLIVAAPFASSATENEMHVWDRPDHDLKDAFGGLGTGNTPDGDENVWIKGTFDTATESKDIAGDTGSGLQLPPVKE